MQRCLGFLIGVLLGLVVSGCAHRHPARNPVGEAFPSVEAKALDGTPLRFPNVVAGEPAIIMVAYVQDAQFDVDRWLIGLTQWDLKVRFYEMPTLPGWAPRVAKGFIDSGMRGGIPAEDWGAVVTVYGDAPKLVRLTGNERTRNARVLLLDRNGKIRWFHDRGFSAGTMRQMIEILQQVEQEGR